MKATYLKHCIITEPDRKAAQAVVLYGGLMGWEGQWFLTHLKIPASLLQNVYFILPIHFTNSLSACLREFRANVDQANISRYSLCGFSRGAQEVYRYRDLETWNILGLVDPSAPTLDIFKDDVLDNVSKKIRCVYWVPNWGKGGYKGRVPRFAQHLRDLKVEMMEQDVAHRDMPTFFLTQFGSEFLQ